ncbi:LOW QUALITY PROTEIN: mast cell protease 3-like [Guaruba guarouba]
MQTLFIPYYSSHFSDLGSQNLNVTYDCDKEPDKSNVSTRTHSPGGIPQGWHSCCTAGSGLNISEIRVVLGAHQASMAEKEQQVFKVMECFPNTQFGSSSKENDTMLLKLNGIAKLSEYTQLLPFPESGKDIKPGTMCIPGWESHLDIRIECSGESGGFLICAGYSGIIFSGKGYGRRDTPGVYM